MRGLLSLLLVILSIFAGCSPSKNSPLVITWAVGKDISGTQRALARQFEAANPGLRVRLIEMPESASTQRDSYVTYFIARDPSVDVYSLDITWPAEFAAAGWLLPLDAWFPKEEQKDFLPGPIAGCSYRGKIYAVPWFTDAGLLYYRTDLLAGEGLQPPRTWAELARQAAMLRDRYQVNGFVYQAAQYEGLVCNFLEYLWSFGGEVYAPDGRVTLDTPQARAALQTLFDTIYVSRIAPPDVLTFKEEESRQVFTSGGSAFLRNWPYVWKIAQDTTTSKVDGRIGIAALPGEKPGGGVSCLGGWNLAISRFSKHPEQAWKLVAFMTSTPSQKTYVLKGGRLPTRTSVYRDEEVLHFAPHYKTLYPVFVNARPRPTSPVYSKLSDILQIELHRALTREQSVGDALRNAQEKIAALER